ncbi:MAG: hypothetical protein HC869_07820 [Rhodospirillales bacterium]|nr:hypothetical protein [Rhodospirillales bacterium]
MGDLSDWPRHDLRRAVLAGLAYFAMVFAAGFVLGTLRVFLLIPRVGETAAVLIELPVILGIAWLACRRLVAAFDVASKLTPRLVMGGVAFLTLMSAELGLSVLAFGRTFADHLDQYRDVHALLGLAGQVAFGLFPSIQLRKGNRSERA